MPVDADAIEFIFIADELALDFVNTVIVLEGERRDLLQSDDQVAHWLERAGLVRAGETLPRYKPHALLRVAHELREIVRDLVERRKRGKRIDPTALNAFLARGYRAVALVQEPSGAVRLESRFRNESPEQLLTPLALSAAEFLATGNFDHVRTCESDDCVLEFYDRTKSHRRRWCSMATCGNRHKVASFRERHATAKGVRG
jgi:predicted RNA-binding Zn ribbon-like protein